MTVLLVDDQISILSGLISGLNWDALGVTTIRTASNSFQAKEILKKEPVELLLCDIEMPGENGLSLLRWARRAGMDFACVFLTSHADFLYAKEAIQLNCFDYILQPARYDDIQSIVSKAVDRVKDLSTERELERYGTVAKNYSASLFQSLFSDWSTGKSLSISSLCDVFRQLGRELQPSDECFVIWGHLLSWYTEPWPTQDWVYAANNIVAEIYGPGDFSLLPFSIDQTSLGWFVHATEHKFSQPEKALLPLQNACFAINSHLPCNFAFYVSPVIALHQINEQSQLLLDAKMNNVLHKSGVFHPTPQLNQVPAEHFFDTVQLRRWESLIAEGNGGIVAEEACRYLETQANHDWLDQNTLRSFWIQFQQAALGAARSRGLNPHKIMLALNIGNRAQSLQEVEAAVQALICCFPLDGGPTENRGKLTGRIKKFVEENLDKPLNVNDIATALFMNADYLSRQFKAETGLSLKEYIAKQKMESVRVLLKTTSLPISVIASKMGYDNFSYFSQAYRKIMGISPSDDRKNT